MWSTGHLSGSNAEYVEELYESFLSDPDSVPEQWRSFFESLPSPDGRGATQDASHADIKRDFKTLSKVSRYAPVLSNEAVINSEHESKQVHVLQLISSYRVRGHQKANLDPRTGCCKNLFAPKRRIQRIPSIFLCPNSSQA